jgi:hypothetical protein
MNMVKTTVRQERWLSVTRVVLVVVGLFTLLSSVALLFAPEWFFENIGHFPPFNRHYMGDLGAFLAALGIGLLVAAAHPERHRLLIVVAALGNTLHVLNHLYDEIVVGEFELNHFLSDGLPLALMAALLWVAVYAVSVSRAPGTEEG